MNVNVKCTNRSARAFFQLFSVKDMLVSMFIFIWMALCGRKSPK